MSEPNPPDGTRVRPSSSEPPNVEHGTRKAPPPETHTPGQTGPWGTGPSLSSVAPTRLGRFEVRQVLGEGTFGRVYLAFDSELGRPVAIKVPKSEGFTAEMRRQFVDEARVVAGIDHPNVCPVYDVGAEGELPFIVMRYVAGGTLSDRLVESIPSRQALVIARKLALGTAAAHAKGVVHRDLKPGNVLYDRANDEVLITDFGLAKLIAADASVSVKGTPLYMPPEQWHPDGPHKVGPLSDVYSLGVILYRLLTGAAPFSGSAYEVMVQHLDSAPRPPSAVRSGLDPRLDAIVLKAMAKSPPDRFPSAQALAEEIAKCLDGPEPAEVVGKPAFACWSEAPSAADTSRPSWSVRRGLLVLAALLIVCAAWLAWSRSNRPEAPVEQSTASDAQNEAGTPQPPERVPEPRPVAASSPPDPKPKESGPKEPAPKDPEPVIDPNKLIGKWTKIESVGGGTVQTWEFKVDDELIVGHSLGPLPFKVVGNGLVAKLPTVKSSRPPPDPKPVYTILRLTDDELEIKSVSGVVARYKKVK